MRDSINTNPDRNQRCEPTVPSTVTGRYLLPNRFVFDWPLPSGPAAEEIFWADLCSCFGNWTAKWPEEKVVWPNLKIQTYTYVCWSFNYSSLNNISVSLAHGFPRR